MPSRKFRIDHIHIGYMAAFVILVIAEALLFSGVYPVSQSPGSARVVGVVMAIGYTLALSGEYFYYVCNAYDSEEF